MSTAKMKQKGSKSSLHMDHVCIKQGPTHLWTSLCSASYVSWQRDTARNCCWAPAVQQSIDISCSPGPQQQTRRTLLQRSIDRADRRTDTVPLHTMRRRGVVVCGVRRMNEVNPRRRARLVLGWVTVFGRVYSVPSRYATSQLGQLSLASLRGRWIEYQLRLG